MGFSGNEDKLSVGNNEYLLKVTAEDESVRTYKIIVVRAASIEEASNTSNTYLKKLNLENGKTFEIEAPENSASNYYIDAMKLNGKNYTRNYITHSDLMNGGKMEAAMSDKPNTKRGTGKNDRPYSFSRDEK